MQELNGETKKIYLKEKPLLINTYWYIQNIEGNPFKKFYIVDIRRLNAEDTLSIFNEFDTIQDELVGNEFFSHVAQNYYICFLCDDKTKYRSMAEKALKDIRYAFKLLINKEELSLMIDNNIDIDHINQEKTINICNQDIKIGNFNLIYGGNGSGKTMLLNAIGAYYDTKPCNMARIGEAQEITLNDSLYLQIFASNFDYMYNYYLYLMSIIRNSKTNDIPILLDDLGWNGLDVINHLKIITLLNEASFEQKVFVTAPQQKIKSLVKGNVYNPNIIEL